MKQIYLISLALLLFTAPLKAADEPPPPPPLPESDAAAGLPEEEAGTEVIIREGERGTIEEYRISGQLYMVKIIPHKGYPYYLIDTDGDGSFETRRNELDNPETVQWEILRWK
jgi:hypothetical protein